MPNRERSDLSGNSVFVSGPRPVCFMHVGKVGGHAISRELLNRYALSDAYNGSPEQYDTLNPTDLLGKSLIIGHFSYCHSKKFPKNRFLFSMVRDPIDRVTSNYWYLRTYSAPTTETSNDMVDLAKAHDFDSFVRLKNLQVRQVVENHQCMFFADDWRSQTRNSEASLGAAIAHLDEFDFVGIYERYSESMQLLAALLGWRPWPSEKKLNATPYREPVNSIGTDTLEYLRSVNALDLKLYDEIKARYLRQQQRILTELVRYRSMEMAKVPAAPPPLLNNIYADLPFNGEGWSERTIVAGHYARWMQPETPATLVSALERSNGGIADVMIVAYSDIQTLESLTLDANGVRCERTALNVQRNDDPEQRAAVVSFRLPTSPEPHLQLSLSCVGYDDGPLVTDRPIHAPMAISAIRLRSLSATFPQSPKLLQKLKQTLGIG